MTSTQIRITSAEYLSSAFDYYEFYADKTNLADADVEADADVTDISFANSWIHAGLTPGDSWYYWIRARWKSGAATGFLKLGPIAVQGISAAILHASAANIVFGRTTAGAGPGEEIPLGAANGIATLDSGGKIPASQLPLIAITDTFPVASQAAMLALTAEKGDVAIRSDVNKSFILSTNSPSTLADWLELKSPTAAVSSVAGKTGAVTLVAADISDATANGQALIKAVNYAAMRTLLGLVIGTDVQAFNFNLNALSALSNNPDTVPYFAGSGTMGVTAFTAFARTLVDDANAAAARATLGLPDYVGPTAFVVTLTCSSGTIALSGSQQTLTYVVFGDAVFISGLIVVSSVSSPAGGLFLNGLPFTIPNNYRNYVAMNARADGLVTGVNGGLQMLGLKNTTTAQIDYLVNGSATDLASKVQGGMNFTFGGWYSKG